MLVRWSTICVGAMTKPKFVWIVNSPKREEIRGTMRKMPDGHAPFAGLVPGLFTKKKVRRVSDDEFLLNTQEL